MDVPRSNYAQIAAYYDQARFLVSEFADFQDANVIRWAGIGPGDRVLDVGCGTGIHTVAIAQTGAAVYGLEPAAEMLAKAEDGDVQSYVAAARTVIGPNPAATAADGKVEAIQKHLAGSLSSPAVNDQLLTPAQYASFPTEIQGFRLLPRSEEHTSELQSLS